MDFHFSGQFQCLEHGLDGLFCWGKPRATVLIARGGSRADVRDVLANGPRFQRQTIS